MNEIRCRRCKAKLAEGEAVDLRIKCRRCGYLNRFEKRPLDKENAKSAECGQGAIAKTATLSG